jgi:peptide deformylase
MGCLEIVLHPDPGLRLVCAEVQIFDDALHRLADDMLATMYAAPGRGLAAPQVGAGCRLFVMDADWKDGVPDPQVFVNPLVLSVSEARAVHAETCLSIPGVTTRISRPAEVTLRWQDLAGVAREGCFAGIAAVCVQHELDHLDGVLSIDHPEVPE